MELQLEIENNVFEGALIKAIEESLFHDLASYIEYALKLTMYNYLSKNTHLILKNDFLTDTTINCHQPKTLTHGFGFNFLDKELTFELSSKIKIKKTGHNKIYFNPFLEGAKMKFFPIKSGYIKDSTNNSYGLFFFMEGRTISNEYYQEVEFTRIARKDVIIKELKTQTNIFINKLRFSFHVENIIHRLSIETIQKLRCTFIPEWFYLCDFEIFNCKHQEITYFNIISGERYICNCTKELHEHLLDSNPPTIRQDNLLMLKDIIYLPRKKDICHICIIKNMVLMSVSNDLDYPTKHYSIVFHRLRFSIIKTLNGAGFIIT